MKRCGRCAAKTVLTEKDIQKMVDEVTALKGIRLVKEDVYSVRINVCAECENFIYKSTCAVCGCVMQVRARLADGKCPKKKW